MALEQNTYNVAMSDDQNGNAELDPRFFDGQLLIDILAWDWNLRLSINSETMRTKARFQGLDYGRDFIIHGCIRAPGALRGKTIKVTLSPFGPKVQFGPRGLQQVGRLMELPEDADSNFEATLMLPEEAIPTTATSLASIWKHLQILTVDEAPEGAKISSYFFGADIHPNLQDWVNAD